MAKKRKSTAQKASNSKRQRRSDGYSGAEDREEQPNSTLSAEEQDNSSISNDGDELADPTSFPVLRPATEHINQRTVRKRWTPLPPGAQERVRGVFTAIERLLIMQHRNDKKRVEAQDVLGTVTKSLDKRLPKMPFPPATKEWHFDYEALLKSNRTLESQVSSTLHAIALLRSEIAKEEEALEQDSYDLAELEKNAKQEEKRLRQQGNKRHSLLRSAPSGPIEDSAEQVRLEPTTAKELQHGKPGPLGEELDAELLAELVPELDNHLVSLETSVSQTEGVGERMELVAAKLDELLFKKLGAEKYKEVEAF